MSTTTAQGPVRHLAAWPATGRRPRHGSQVPVDVYRCQDHYVILCDLPGLDAGTLDVTIDGTAVTVRGRRSAPPLAGATRVTNQRRLGPIERRIELDEPATGRGITATYTDGVLTLTVPTAEPRPSHLHDARWPAHVVRAVA